MLRLLTMSDQWVRGKVDSAQSEASRSHKFTMLLTFTTKALPCKILRRAHQCPLHCQCLTRSQGTVLVSDTRSLLVRHLVAC